MTAGTGATAGASTAEGSTVQGASSVDPSATSVADGTASSGSTSRGATSSSTSSGQTGPDYVLSIDDQGVVARLLQIDTATGIGSEICLLQRDLNYNSLAFARDGILFAHAVNEMAIDRIDPCTCETVRLADALAGNIQLTADAANGLYALDLTNDVFAEVNPATGALTTIGPLGLDFANTGIAWSDDVGAVLALEAVTDQLYTIDVATGAAANPVAVGGDFTSVGLDFHPGHGVLYACTGTGTLSTIDPATGALVEIGDIGGSTCDNIAAPWEPIDCLER